MRSNRKFSLIEKEKKILLDNWMRIYRKVFKELVYIVQSLKDYFTPVVQHKGLPVGHFELEPNLN